MGPSVAAQVRLAPEAVDRERDDVEQQVLDEDPIERPDKPFETLRPVILEL
jgi:hypothetical protein